jgi:regulator of sigma D
MLLTTLNRTKQVSAGNLKWIDEMIHSREKMITMYFMLLTLPVDRDNSNELDCHPSYEQLVEFCNILIDYLSRGHFEIYPKILTIMEHVSNRRLTVARRLIPRIENTTEHILEFHDKYSTELNEEKLKTLRQDLGSLGQWLEIRFKHEDRMVIALQIMDNTIQAACQNC